MSKAASTPLVESPRGGLNLKRAAWITFGVLGLLLASVLVVPHFIDLGLFKRTYLPLLEDVLNRRIDVNEVHLSLVPTPSISLSALKVSDSAAFADNTFFSAQQVQLKLRFLPLLRGRFEITELILDKPIFNLLKQSDGSFNYSDIGSKKTQANPRREAKKKLDPAKSGDAAALLVIPNRLRIQDGQLNLATKGQTPLNIKGIDLSIQEFRGSAPFPIRLSFNYPGLKTVSLEGELNYQEDKALIELKNNRLKILDLTLPVQGSINNLATVPRLNLTMNRDGVDAGTIFQILSVFGLAPRDTEISGPMG
ncbi:MAG TPA: AsmA family protein, partial [Candidatus Binatus sp.]|nr:AsmA family protein [Candidatus Binatus sp.]